MRVVNVKEMKARLSAYLREVVRGEEFLVTDRNRVVARLGPPPGAADADAPPHCGPADLVARLARLGVRPPLRERRAGDYRRTGPVSGLSTRQIDALLDAVREEAR
jgi:prevent-host-death family protein